VIWRRASPGGLVVDNCRPTSRGFGPLWGSVGRYPARPRRRAAECPRGCSVPGRGTEMMTEEEYMDVVALARQGWTIGEIAEAVGHHPATVSHWLKNGGPPPKRHRPHPARGEQVLGQSDHRDPEGELQPAGYLGGAPTAGRRLRWQLPKPDPASAKCPGSASPPGPRGERADRDCRRRGGPMWLST
jgi:hypothetical protein